MMNYNNPLVDVVLQQARPQGLVTNHMYMFNNMYETYVVRLMYSIVYRL